MTGFVIKRNRMFFLQMKSVQRKFIHSHLMLYHRNEKFIHQATFYRNLLNNLNIDTSAITRTKDKVKDDIRIYKQNSDNFSKKLIQDDRYRPSHDLHHLHSRKLLEELWSTSTSKLKDIYQIVTNEFSMAYPLSEKCEQLKNDQYKYTITVLWPTKATFEYIGSRKKKAQQGASFKVLEWLYENKKLQISPVVKPIIYTQEEIDKLMTYPIGVTFESKFKDEVVMLLDTFKNKIKPLLDIAVENGSTVFQEENEQSVSSQENIEMDDTNKKYVSSKVQHRNPSNLPIADYREEILDSIKNNQVVLICGETGCGKSTQIPQFIMDSYIAKNKTDACNIIVSEPRKIAAISLAERVASERAEVVGDSIGFQVRLRAQLPGTSPSTLYCTTGILLRRIQSNPTLEGVSHVIIDEAHERGLHIDILLNLLKRMLAKNPSLKLIIMSATMNAKLFQDYYTCTVVTVPGKMYPVKIHFMEDLPFQMSRTGKEIEKEVPYKEIVKLIEYILENKPPGAILCFLPGWLEINYMRKMLQQIQNDNILILLLHSNLPNHVQKKVFRRADDNVTKIILSTNIAESSITIDDVKYVIDTALKRYVGWQDWKGMFRIGTSLISQADIKQRRGRAGRTGPGESYHLISKEDYRQLDAYPVSEIMTSPLEDSIMTCKMIDNDRRVQDFFNDMIEPPSNAVVCNAVERLKQLRVLDEDEKLTVIGKRISNISMDIKFRKAFLYSSIFQCVNPILSICVLSSRDNIVKVACTNDKSLLREMKLKFDQNSDHIAMFKMVQQMVTEKGFNEHNKDTGCRKSEEQSIHNGCQGILDMYLLHLNELSCSTVDMPIDTTDYTTLNKYAAEDELVCALLYFATGQLIKHSPYGYKKRGHFTKNLNMLRSGSGRNIFLSRDSVNDKRKKWPTPFLTYVTETEQHNIHWVHDTSLLSPLSVLLFSPGLYITNKFDGKLPGTTDNVFIGIENLKNIVLRMDRENAALLLKLRQALWSVVNYILMYRNTSQMENVDIVNDYKDKLLCFLVRILKKSRNDIIDQSTDSSDS